MKRVRSLKCCRPVIVGGGSRLEVFGDEMLQQAPRRFSAGCGRIYFRPATSFSLAAVPGAFAIERQPLTRDYRERRTVHCSRRCGGHGLHVER